MPVIVHLADLHLAAAESGYSFAVLDEILALAAEHRADYLLMSGDIFDSAEDAYNLRADFRQRIGGLDKKTEILYIPGNHELPKKKSQSLETLDLGRIHFLHNPPCTLLTRDRLEFLAIPHQEDYKDYRQWPVPPKDPGNIRIALAHASISGLSFTGFEEGGTVMDTDLFDFFQVDYAALGHIHDRRSARAGAGQLHYPGSARVWRRGEAGPRGINLLQVGETVSARFIPLASAGQYREYIIPVNFDGVPEITDDMTGEWNSTDWIDMNMSGVVEDENILARRVEELRERFSRQVRILNVYRENVTVFSGISSHPIAREFIRLWKKNMPASAGEEEKATWLEAREMGLAEIKTLLEAKA